MVTESLGIISETLAEVAERNPGPRVRVRNRRPAISAGTAWNADLRSAPLRGAQRKRVAPFALTGRRPGTPVFIQTGTVARQGDEAA